MCRVAYSTKDTSCRVSEAVNRGLGAALRARDAAAAERTCLAANAEAAVEAAEDDAEAEAGFEGAEGEAIAPGGKAVEWVAMEGAADWRAE